MPVLRFFFCNRITCSSKDLIARDHQPYVCKKESFKPLANRLLLVYRLISRCKFFREGEGSFYESLCFWVARGLCVCSLAVRSSGTVVLRTAAKTSNVLSVTFRSQRSTDPIYVRCSPHSSASFSCEILRASRKSRRLSASTAVNWPLGFLICFGGIAFRGCLTNRTTQQSSRNDEFESTDLE